MNNCSICYKKYTSKTRKRIPCNNCDIDICAECFRNNMKYNDNMMETKCIQCDHIFNINYLSDYLPKTFFINELVDKQAKEALKMEESLLKETQFEIDEKNKYLVKFNNHMDKLLDEKNELINNKIKPLENKKLKLLKEIKKIDEEINTVNNIFIKPIDNNIEELEHQFINNNNLSKSYNYLKKCCNVNGDNTCKGFVDLTGFCSLCENTICIKCHENIDSTDENIHVCDPNIVKNIKYINRNTKKCPSCMKYLYKTVGCSKILCNGCNIYIDWDTLDILRPVINNNGINWISSDNDKKIKLNEVKLQKLYKNENIPKIIINLYDTLDRIKNITINKKKYKTDDLSNFMRKLRIDYLNGEINNRTWINKIKNKYRLVNRNDKIKEILLTFYNSAIDILYQITTLQFNKNNKAKTLFKHLNNIRKICNKDLINIKKIYKIKNIEQYNNEFDEVISNELIL